MIKNIQQKGQQGLFLAIVCFFLGAGAWGQSISVQLDGKNLNFDQPPAMIDGRLLVPLRGIFEALAADVLYDAATRSIKATKGTTIVQLQLGSRTALIDGRTVYLDVPADTVGGRTMVPLRFVSESLGAEVKWNGAMRIVELSSGVASSNTDSSDSSASSSDVLDIEKPKIDQIIHSATTALKPKDMLEVVATGSPDATASFEILGKTQEISMPEVSPGRYQARWRIPNGLLVNKGVIIVHLRKGRLESVLEANRNITVQADNAGSTSTTSSEWITDPPANGVVNTVRPQLTVNLPTSILAGTARLYVDGLDFSQQLTSSGNRLSWSPSYNLSPGTHSAQVRASASNGQQLDYQWSFSVDSSGRTTLAVSKLSPAEGEAVASNRPAIEAIFNQTLKDIRLSLDNVDITEQPGVSLQSNGISFTPNYKLANGTHRVVVTATDVYNRSITKQWSFRVGKSTATKSGSSTQIFAVTNLVNGATVPADFTVSGTAEPGRQITVVTEYSSNNILEVITGQARRLTQAVLTNSSGNFSIKPNISAIRSSQTFRLTVSDGGNSSNLVYTLRKQ